MLFRASRAACRFAVGQRRASLLLCQRNIRPTVISLESFNADKHLLAQINIWLCFAAHEMSLLENPRARAHGSLPDDQSRFSQDRANISDAPKHPKVIVLRQ